ncbi:MAG: metal-sulfur cluster assembly factor [Nanopusillaceae archaeon]|jgi:metal-sulfur cluster biosynthetic enzyme
MVDINIIKEKLKEVIDPEIGYDIVSLGEIEDIKEKDGKIIITFLPTTPLCPFIPAILDSIAEKMKETNLDFDIEVDLENKWNIERIEPEIRKKLGL